MCAGKKAVAEPVSSVFFRRAALALAVSAAFASATGVAGEKLDMSFIQGGAGVNPEDGELTDADRIHGIVNAVNGSEADCILSVLPSPAQEDFIEQNRALIDTRVWIGCGTVLMRSFDDRKMTSRIKRMLVKKVFRYKVEKQN